MTNKYIIYLLMIMVNDCSSASFLHKLRRQKTIEFQPNLSSPSEFDIAEGLKFRLTCTFISNFDQIDIYWLHNGALIQSFISDSIDEDEDGKSNRSFLAVTIISTIEIKKTHMDMHGLYQCVGVYKEIYAQHTFHVNVVTNETTYVPANFAEDAMITVHTYQSLFEPRNQITLMCRLADNRRDKCTTKWFDPEFETLESPSGKTDLILNNANFDDDMGLYTCQICCSKRCQTLTSFVYPAASDK